MWNTIASNSNNALAINAAPQMQSGWKLDINVILLYTIPWSPPTCPFGPTHMVASIVLFYPSVGVHSKANVRLPLVTRVGGYQQVAAKKFPFRVGVRVLLKVYVDFAVVSFIIFIAKTKCHFKIIIRRP